MKERVAYIILYWFYWFLVFVLQKPIFLLIQYSESKNYSLGDMFDVIKHGISMDLSTTGYFSIIVILLMLISSFFKDYKWGGKIICYYTIAMIVIINLIFIADLFLYKYWGFRIDSTPLFYLKTPKDAMASGTWHEFLLAGFLYAAFLCISIYAFLKMHKRFFKISGKSYMNLIPSILLLCFAIVFIRGGIGVSTMNVGRVYFSNAIFLNHAAINPIWNFIYSCTKTNDFSEQYRFMSDQKAGEIFKELSPVKNDSTETSLLNTTRPNIILIIMEGIGSNMIEPLGGEKGATPNLNQLTKEGILFDHFYANSFRTDRGLVAILSGYPAQPTTSLMKYPSKTQNTPKIPLTLKEAGYDITFYYGGDENFTNLRSYLITSGFERIISEKDFKGKDLSTKWGAYDHVLLNKVKEDLKEPQKEPFLKTILTLSSHEPFDVPMQKFEQPYINSVAYTDSCIGDFINEYKSSDLWKNSLIIILPDHAYRYPRDLSNMDEKRYQIPMIWVGGAVDSIQTISKIASQMDIANTLLTQLELDASEYIFSKNILGKNYPEFAYYAFNDGFGFVTEDGVSVFDNAANKPVRNDNEDLLEKGKAFLQTIYDDLAKR